MKVLQAIASYNKKDRQENPLMSIIASCKVGKYLAKHPCARAESLETMKVKKSQIDSVVTKVSNWDRPVDPATKADLHELSTAMNEFSNAVAEKGVAAPDQMTNFVDCVDKRLLGLATAALSTMLQTVEPNVAAPNANLKFQDTKRSLSDVKALQELIGIWFVWGKQRLEYQKLGGEEPGFPTPEVNPIILRKIASAFSSAAAAMSEEDFTTGFAELDVLKLTSLGTRLLDSKFDVAEIPECLVVQGLAEFMASVDKHLKEVLNLIAEAIHDKIGNNADKTLALTWEQIGEAFRDDEVGAAQLVLTPEIEETVDNLKINAEICKIDSVYGSCRILAAVPATSNKFSQLADNLHKMSSLLSPFVDVCKMEKYAVAHLARPSDIPRETAFLTAFTEVCNHMASVEKLTDSPVKSGLVALRTSRSGTVREIASESVKEVRGQIQALSRMQVDVKKICKDFDERSSELMNYPERAEFLTTLKALQGSQNGGLKRLDRVVPPLSCCGIQEIEGIDLQTLKGDAKQARDKARVQACARSATLIILRKKRDEIKGLEQECSLLKVSLPPQLKERLKALKEDED